MNIGQPNWLIRAETQAIFDALSGDNQKSETYLVGGCIRNHLMGFPVTDIDMATAWRPEQVMDRLRAAGIKTVPTGIKYGTVTAIFDAFKIEITTFRYDIRTDGRHAMVQYSDSWQEDAVRRDFTINALYTDRQGKIYDIVGGVKDIEKKLVRFIGDPEQRIKEDYLRILRYFRFQAWFGRKIDQASLGACIKYQKHLADLSGERIKSELFKLLLAPNPISILKLIQKINIFNNIELKLFNINILKSVIKKENELKNFDPLRRLASVIVPTFDKNLKQNFKLSNEEFDRLNFIAKNRIKLLIPQKAWLKTLYKLNPQYAFDLLIVSKTMNYKQLLDLTFNYQKPKMPISAQDLLNLGMQPGPLLGNVLKQTENQWNNSDFKSDRDTLLEFARQELSRH